MKKVNYNGGRMIVDAELGLKRKHFSLLAIVAFIFSECAAGAYGIEEMISGAAPGLTLLLLAIIPFVWALPAGLAVAECSNLIPASSGPYVWTKMAFGEFWGFSMGWWMIFASYLTPVAYVILTVDYMSTYIHLSPLAEFIVKTIMIAIFTIINILGLEEVSLTSIILSIIILVGFGVVTVVGFMNWHHNPVTPFVPPGHIGFSDVGTAVVVGIWMYAGFVELAPICGEIKNQEVLPKGMKIAVLIMAISYILPTVAGVVSTQPWSNWGTQSGNFDFSSVLTLHIGPLAGIAFMIVSVVAQCAIFNAAIAVASRAFTMMSLDNLSPKFLNRLTKRGKTPIWPILILAAFCMVLMNFDFTDAIGILDITLFLIYIGLAVVTLKLRYLYPVEKREGLYYVKGKLGWAFILLGPLCLGLLAWLISGAEFFLLGFIPVLAVVPLYLAIKRKTGGLHKIDPENNPINPRTRLAEGDTIRIANFCLIFGPLAAVGSFFIRFYEKSWGPEYYLEMYEKGLLSDFDSMLKAILILGIVLIVIGVLLRLWGKKNDPIEHTLLRP